MYEFLNECDILKLNQDGINNLNKSITNKRTEAVIKSLSAKIAQDLMNSLQNATRASRRASAILIKLTHKREEEKMLPGFSYKVSITLILQSDKKQQQQKENSRLVFQLYTNAKVFNEVHGSKTQDDIKWSFIMIKLVY